MSTILAAAFLCTVIGVHDGDSLRCADGTRIRLAAIDAPEISGCRGKRGRVCVPGNAPASRDNLARLSLNRTITCRKTGTSYKRTVAFCSIGGVDLSCAQVSSGHAVERYGKLRGCRP